MGGFSYPGVIHIVLWKFDNLPSNIDLCSTGYANFRSVEIRSGACLRCSDAARENEVAML